jgi:hypothetical protein
MSLTWNAAPIRRSLSNVWEEPSLCGTEGRVRRHLPLTSIVPIQQYLASAQPPVKDAGYWENSRGAML